ncbi:MAG: hypothetical protein WC602_01780 [archaeon]
MAIIVYALWFLGWLVIKTNYWLNALRTRLIRQLADGQARLSNPVGQVKLYSLSPGFLLWQLPVAFA